MSVIPLYSSRGGGRRGVDVADVESVPSGEMKLDVKGFRVLVCRDSMGEAFIGYAMSDKGNQTSSSVGSGTIKAADVVAWEVGFGVVLYQLGLLYAKSCSSWHSCEAPRQRC